MQVIKATVWKFQRFSSCHSQQKKISGWICDSQIPVWMNANKFDRKLEPDRGPQTQASASLCIPPFLDLKTPLQSRNHYSGLKQVQRRCYLKHLFRRFSLSNFLPCYFDIFLPLLNHFTHQHTSVTPPLLWSRSGTPSWRVSWAPVWEATPERALWRSGGYSAYAPLIIKSFLHLLGSRSKPPKNSTVTRIMKAHLSDC